MAGIKLCPFCGEMLKRDILTGDVNCPKGCGTHTDYVIQALRQKKARQEAAKKGSP